MARWRSRTGSPSSAPPAPDPPGADPRRARRCWRSIGATRPRPCCGRAGSTTISPPPTRRLSRTLRCRPASRRPAARLDRLLWDGRTEQARRMLGWVAGPARAVGAPAWRCRPVLPMSTRPWQRCRRPRPATRPAVRPAALAGGQRQRGRRARDPAAAAAAAGPAGTLVGGAAGGDPRRRRPGRSSSPTAGERRRQPAGAARAEANGWRAGSPPVHRPAATGGPRISSGCGRRSARRSAVPGPATGWPGRGRCAGDRPAAAGLVQAGGRLAAHVLRPARGAGDRRRPARPGAAAPQPAAGRAARPCAGARRHGWPGCSAGRAARMRRSRFLRHSGYATAGDPEALRGGRAGPASAAVPTGAWPRPGPRPATAPIWSARSFPLPRVAGVPASGRRPAGAGPAACGGPAGKPVRSRRAQRRRCAGADAADAGHRRRRSRAELGVPSPAPGLIADPDYNVRLGASIWRGSWTVSTSEPALALAAYNAGPAGSRNGSRPMATRAARTAIGWSTGSS